jgi:hypothetical protein
MTNETTVYEVGADVGNARTVITVRDPQSGKISDVRFPSVKSLRGASARSLFAQRGISLGQWSRLRDVDHILTVDGIERFIGLLAVEQAAVADAARGSDSRYYDGFIDDFLLAGVATALPKVNEITIRLSVVVPAELWGGINERVATALTRSFRYAYNGREVSLNVVETIVLREGHAAWYVLPEHQRGGRTLVIDGGGRTFNIVALDGGLLSAPPKTLDLGIEGVLDDVDNTLINQGARALTLRERIALQDALRKNEPYSINHDRQKVAIDPIAKAHFKSAAQSFAQVLRARVPLAMADHLWLVGGAVYFMADTLQANIPGLCVPDDAEALNAYGALAALVDAPIKKGRKR